MSTQFRNHFSLLALALMLCCGIVDSLDAAMFTLDFENPSGVGSSFSDAISLNTVGAITDVNGTPVGFTHSTQSGLQEDQVELTGAGLVFDIIGGGSIALGVPFATDGSGTVSVTARFNGIFNDWGTRFEQTGVLIGDVSSTGISNAHSVFAWVSADSPQFNHSLAPDPWNTGADTDNNQSSAITQILLSGPTTVGGTISGSITAGGTNSFTGTDGFGGSPNHLGQSDAYAYFFVSPAGGNGFSGTLTSISFSGPNVLALEQVVPEPSTALMLGLGAFGLVHHRRRRTRSSRRVK